MRPKLLKTSVAEYITSEWTGRNECGFAPIADKVIVLTDQAADHTKGGVFITEDSVERNTLAAETGILVACGPLAFSWMPDRSRKWDGEEGKPTIGDRVWIDRYSGRVMLGKDGQFYRVCDDTCIAAVEIKEEAVL
jgi:co-chaperonin GroES (HSP10)